MIGSHADVRPDQYRFARQQSYSMREASLEKLKPIKAWGPKLLSFIGYAFLVGAAVLLVVR